jgi:hypothetical protein
MDALVIHFGRSQQRTEMSDMALTKGCTRLETRMERPKQNARVLREAVKLRRRCKGRSPMRHNLDLTDCKPVLRTSVAAQSEDIGE